MEPVCEPPEGYQKPVHYELSSWFSIIAFLPLLGIYLFLILTLRVTVPALSESAVWLVAGGFGTAGSIFLHESLHYVSVDWLGGDPEYDWPTSVKFGRDILYTQDTVISLLAPQILSIIYLVPLYYGVPPALDLMLWIALAINLIDGYKDVAWSVRRLTWPKGTIVIRGKNDENFVSFPED